jgi:hypothetical protein
LDFYSAFPRNKRLLTLCHSSLTHCPESELMLPFLFIESYIQFSRTVLYRSRRATY